MKKLIVIIILTWAGALHAVPSFNIDYAAFRAGDGTFLQIYTMIQRNSLNFKQTGDVLAAEYTLTVEITRDDSSLASWTYDRTSKAASADEITPTQKIPEEASFRIRPGEYTIVVSVTDGNSGETRRREMDIAVQNFTKNELAVSNIEFATKIEHSSDASGPFIKRQLLIIPNADRIFGEDLMTAYYYTEIYNLCLDSLGKEYTVVRTILDQNRKCVKTLLEKTRPQNASSVVEADLFSCATLSTGSYFLNIAVIDGCTGERVEVEKAFWVFKQGEELLPEPTLAYGFLEEKIESLSEEETKREIEYIRFITSRSENKVIKKLEPTGHKNFLISFWRNRDASGEMRFKYLARVNFANERYSTPMRKGWKTDRGRVLIVYGEPDMVERKNFELSGGDSEVWYYDRIEGGILFVFFDLKGIGDLQQVYSTKRGEYIDAGWVKEMEIRSQGPGLQSLGIH